jgi:holliday junction DNA helicase RuvA
MQAAVRPRPYTSLVMIAHLTGLLLSKSADRLVLDVNGVGYEVVIPFSTYYDLKEPGERVSLHVHTHVKEDTLSLYGFLTLPEKKLFTQLIQISSIGPKLAVTILSGLPVDELRAAVVRADVHRLSSIPGIGKKTAERIILELKDKISKDGAAAPEEARLGVSGVLQSDVVSALVNLGYARNIAEKAVSRALKEGDHRRFEDLLKKSLRMI